MTVTPRDPRHYHFHTPCSYIVKCNLVNFTSIRKAVVEKTFNIFLPSNMATKQRDLIILYHPSIPISMVNMSDVSPQSVWPFWRKIFFLWFQGNSKDGCQTMRPMTSQLSNFIQHGNSIIWVQFHFNL